MPSKKNWVKPQLRSLNLIKTQSDPDISTNSGIAVEFTDNYQPPVDLGNISDSSSSSSNASSNYCFSTES